MSLLLGALLITTRITTMVCTAPILGHRQVGWWVRIGLSIALSTLVSSLAAEEHVVSIAACADLISMLMSEALIGLMLGLSISLLLAAAELMGDILGQVSGVTNVICGDDQADEPAAHTRLIGLLALILFLLARGPELLVGGVLDSFRAIPVGRPPIGETGLIFLGEVINQSVWLALKGVGPGVAALFTATLLVQLIQRVLPGLNLMYSTPAIGACVFGLALFVTISGGLWLVDGNWESVQDLLLEQLRRINSVSPGNANTLLD